MTSSASSTARLGMVASALAANISGLGVLYAFANKMVMAPMETTITVVIACIAVVVLMSTLIAAIGGTYFWQAVAGLAALALVPGVSWKVGPHLAIALCMSLPFMVTVAVFSLTWRVQNSREVKYNVSLVHDIAEAEVVLADVETTWLYDALDADPDRNFTRSQLIDFVVLYYDAQTARGLARANRLCVPADMVSELMDRPAFTEADADRLAAGGAA